MPLCIWLDTMNAKAMLNEMAEHLIENDQKNEAKYKSNLDKALKDIDKLTIEVMTELNNSVSSIVFHDAYQYFEKRFNVNVLGAFTVNTDVMPGAEQEIGQMSEMLGGFMTESFSNDGTFGLDETMILESVPTSSSNLLLETVKEHSSFI